MINYKEIKNYIDDINNNQLDPDSKLLIMLCKYHYSEFKSLILDYLPWGKDNLNDIAKIMKNNYVYIFFRYFYLFYILTKYVYHNFKVDQNVLKQTFDYYTQYSIENCNQNKTLCNQIYSLLVDNYDYLYDTFFVKDNIYFGTYFNNLIKYFLPLPYQYLIYSPIITFRHNVNSFYKKNDIDYLDQIKPIDTTERKRYTGNKNIDKIKNEIDIHIPLKYYKDDPNYIKLVAYKMAPNKYKLLIANDLEFGEIVNIKNISFERNFEGYDEEQYKLGFPFQIISKRWENRNKNTQYSINSNDIVYISVMRKIDQNDLYNVFNEINLDKTNYQFLFHNTAYDITGKNVNHILNNPSFFYLTPMGSESYIDKYFKNRKCILFKIKKNIKVLDLTQSVIVNNPFIYNKIKEQHRDEKLWKFYDTKDIMNYYQNKDLPLTFHENNKCLTTKDIYIGDFLKERPYCDIGAKQYYVGRRKLYEIFIKNRKYEISTIWPADYLMEVFLPVDINMCNYIIGLLYNRKNIPADTADCDYIKDELYYDPDMIISNVLAYLYDAFLLKKIGYTGFFFTDFDEAFKYGGELFLSNPDEYINPFKYSDQTCNIKVEFNELELSNKKQSRPITKSSKYAYVALLMGNSAYFLGALVLGYSLRTVETQYDIVIMVTPDVPQKQKEILSEFFKIIDIDFLTIDKSLIKDYENNRFKDVFTKLQCLTLTKYEKIIMIDIDMLVIKNMDHLFNLNPPAASLRRYDLKHGKHIPENLIVKNNKLIGGINAGLMLLKPDLNEYQDIVKDLLNPNSNMTGFKNPEQDYLSYRYSKQWTNISFKYNFQFGLTDRAKKFETNDIYNLHYSSRLKPWRILKKPEETWKWINEEPINKPYYEMWISVYEILYNKFYLKNINLNELFI